MSIEEGASIKLVKSVDVRNRAKDKALESRVAEYQKVIHVLKYVRAMDKKDVERLFSGGPRKKVRVGGSFGLYVSPVILRFFWLFGCFDSVEYVHAGTERSVDIREMEMYYVDKPRAADLGRSDYILRTLRGRWFRWDEVAGLFVSFRDFNDDEVLESTLSKAQILRQNRALGNYRIARRVHESLYAAGKKESLDFPSFKDWWDQNPDAHKLSYMSTGPTYRRKVSEDRDVPVREYEKELGAYEEYYNRYLKNMAQRPKE